MKKLKFVVSIALADVDEFDSVSDVRNFLERELLDHFGDRVPSECTDEGGGISVIPMATGKGAPWIPR